MGYSVSLNFCINQQLHTYLLPPLLPTAALTCVRQLVIVAPTGGESAHCICGGSRTSLARWGSVGSLVDCKPTRSTDYRNSWQSRKAGKARRSAVVRKACRHMVSTTTRGKARARVLVVVRMCCSSSAVVRDSSIVMIMGRSGIVVVMDCSSSVMFVRGSSISMPGERSIIMMVVMMRYCDHNSLESTDWATIQGWGFFTCNWRLSW